MKPSTFAKLVSIAVLGVWLTGCANQTKGYDYTAFKESRPKSILVLPPLNQTTEVHASNSFLSHTTYPLAEAGYYVLPVTLVAETFKENGMDHPAQMHEAPADKLREIFGADAALYINIQQYGTTFVVVQSQTVATADAKLMDLRTGKLLWQGKAVASSAENQNNNQGGLAALLVAAIVKQVVASVADESHQIGGVAAARLLTAGQPNGILRGHRSTKFGQD
jgi:hypothetical protein